MLLSCNSYTGDSVFVMRGRRLAAITSTLVKRHEWRLAVKVIVLRVRLVKGKPPMGDVRLPVNGGAVYLARETMAIDFETFLEMYVDVVFRPECRERFVYDFGAHKGYFAAWALGQGAVGVASYEPQSQNFHYLTQAHDTHSRRDAWSIHRMAGGAFEGVADLYLSSESWAHSMYASLAQSTSTEQVPVTTLSAALAANADRSEGADVVIKANVEGAVADILMSASPEEFMRVVEIWFDYETGSPYQVDDLLEYLGSCGLTEVEKPSDRHFTVRRVRA